MVTVSGCFKIILKNISSNYCMLSSKWDSYFLYFNKPVVQSFAC